MNRSNLFAAILFGCAVCASATTPSGLTTLPAIKTLTNDQAKAQMSVSFEATVTYFRSYERVLFVQDGDAAIFVTVAPDLKLIPGDRVLVRGTMRASFRPYVVASEVKVLGHGNLPKPLPATFDEMIRAETDCQLVTVHATIRSADLWTSSNFLVTTTHMQMLIDGEPAEANVDSNDGNALKGLLDAEVEITGVVSGEFDNKMQQTGVLFHLQSLAGVKVLKHASVDPWSLAVTPMDRLAIGHRVRDLSARMRVHGRVTYYEPSVGLVLQNGSKSVWITTENASNLRVGDLADVIGFPDVQNGFLTLRQSEIRDDSAQASVTPALFTWRDLSLGGNNGRSHVFDLVSIEGQVVTEVRQATQDEYVLRADGHLFSAILRHPGSVSRIPLAPMRQIPVGSRIRVTGICMLADANPFNGEVPFNILLRTYDDMYVVAKPPWLNVSHLIFLVGLLILVIFAGGARGWYVERKMRCETSGLAYVEQRRSRVLEAINASRPLAEILEEITELVSFKLKGAPSWCEVAGGARLGNCPSEVSETFSIMECPVAAPAGPLLGKFFAALCPHARCRTEAQEALSMAASLARLAIETSRLHHDLVHRSEFDLLTDIQNRFSLEKHLETMIHATRQSAGIFGLIYIDLNEFKQVNDRYGHQVGDIYLQQVAQRMKKQLRPADILARLGGDEFAVLVPEVRSRAIVEEITLRLERCFDKPFTLEKGSIVHGSASIGFALYPEDATTKDGLLSTADVAMYSAKKARQRFRQMPSSELTAEAVHEESK